MSTNTTSQWIRCAAAGAPPFVTAYRRCFQLARAARIRVQVTADERYELFLDGRRIGRGSERGDPANWFFETYDLALTPGAHVLVARVWSLGDAAPLAQMSVAPGFLLTAGGRYAALLTTGLAAWDAKKLGGYSFDNSQRPGNHYYAAGARFIIDGAHFDWGFESGAGEGWTPALAGEEVHAEFSPTGECFSPRRLRPATLPSMLEAARRVGPTRAILFPANTTRRIVIDLKNYYCAYPELVVSGGRGSRIRWSWAESLYEERGGRIKGNRNDITGKHFIGVGDVFLPDGGAHRRFEPLWWCAGRFIELAVETGAEPLTLEQLVVRETRYPLEAESTFATSDPRLQRITTMAIRALQMSAHETYMDCPYYEQLMYVADTRLESLITFVLTRDDRLPRKALQMFDASRRLNGLTQCRYPTRLAQVIPPFSLWWVAMVHDYARWRGDRALVRRLMPGVRAVVEAFVSFLNQDGFVAAPPGWNNVDWVPAWHLGIPPDGESGVSGLINWQFALVLTQVAELEQWMNEPELATRAEHLSADLATRLLATFWSERRSLLADDLAKKQFSEHTQCLAILSGRLPATIQSRLQPALLGDRHLERTTIYFTHYLFEAYQRLGATDALFRRLGLWFELEKLGLKTTVESPEPARSDCHGWGAHPLFHFYGTILGIRPASMGFKTVRIEPQLGRLTAARGRLVHPAGVIAVNFRQQNHRLRGHVSLPRGVTGTFIRGSTTLPLHGGRQTIDCG